MPCPCLWGAVAAEAKSFEAVEDYAVGVLSNSLKNMRVRAVDYVGSGIYGGSAYRALRVKDPVAPSLPQCIRTMIISQMPSAFSCSTPARTCSKVAIHGASRDRCEFLVNGVYNAVGLRDRLSLGVQ